MSLHAHGASPRPRVQCLSYSASVKPGKYQFVHTLATYLSTCQTWRSLICKSAFFHSCTRAGAGAGAVRAPGARTAAPRIENCRTGATMRFSCSCLFCCCGLSLRCGQHQPLKLAAASTAAWLLCVTSPGLRCLFTKLLLCIDGLGTAVGKRM